MNVSKTNGVKLFALVAVLAMVFAGAAVMMDDGVDAKTTTSGGTTYLSGDVTSTQKFNSATNVVVNNNLVIPAGMALIIEGTFTLDEGYTITIEAGGQLIFNGSKTVTINGNIVASGVPSTMPESGYVAAIVNNMSYTVGEKTGLFVNGNITLERGAELTNYSGTATVGYSTATDEETDVGEEEGDAEASDNTESFTSSASEGSLIINNGGSISVTKRSANISSIENQNIYLYEGATFNLNGYAKNVDVNATGSATYYTAGSVNITNDSTEHNVYPANNRNTSELTFTVTTQTASAFIGNDTTQSYTIRQYIVNVEGTINSVHVDATTKPEKAAYEIRDTLTFNAGSSYNGKTSGVEYKVANSDGTAGDVIVPMNSITGTLEASEYSKITYAEGSYTIISGTMDFEYAESDNPAQGTKVQTIEVNGTLYITGTVTGVLDAIKANGTGGDVTTPHEIIVDGGVMELQSSVDTVTGMAGLANNSNSGYHIFGTMYITEAPNNADFDYIVNIMDFDAAIEAATAAEVEDVTVFAWGAQNVAEQGGTDDAQNALDRGAYEITSAITIPSFMTLTVWNSLVIGEEGVLTLEDGAEIVLDTEASRIQGDSKLFVQGQLIDNGGAMEQYEDDTYFHYEVKLVSEDELVSTYTTLRIALADAAEGETIQLHNQIVISEDLTIPAGVTVITGANGSEGEAAITLQGATLTVNGTLQMASTAATISLDKDGNTESRIVVNNIITNAVTGTFTGDTTTVAGAYFVGQIGEDNDNTSYVTSVAVAAQNSTTTSDIKIYGTVSMGDVTFTAGDNGLKVTIADKAVATAGTVTIDGTEFIIIGTFTGSVSSAVTAGTSTVDFNRASGMTVAIASADDGQTVTETVTVAGNLKGNMTVAAGEVYVAISGVKVTYTPASGEGDNKVAEDKAVLTVANGATLVVPRNATLTVDDNDAEKAYAGLIVAGTMTVQNGGKFNVDAAADSNDNAAQVDVTGTLNIEVNITINGVLNVTGTLAVTEAENTNVVLTIADRLNVGDGEGAAGTVTGAVKLSAVGDIVTVYPAGNVSGAAIDMNADGTTNAYQTAFYINGDLYMTTYALATTTVGAVLGTEPIAMSGYYPIEIVASGDDVSENNTTWYSTPEMEIADQIYSGDAVENVSTAYAEAAPRTASIQFSVGQGMSVFVDNVRYANGTTIHDFTVGTHTVMVQVNPGYTGTASILFNGQAVTGGTFEITADMAGETIVLSVTGEIAVDTGSTGSSDDGMGLTEILLIILVVLIVVMAIMVALRLMRS